MDGDLREVDIQADRIKFIALHLAGECPDWVLNAIEQLANDIQFLIRNVDIAEERDMDATHPPPEDCDERNCRKCIHFQVCRLLDSEMKQRFEQMSSFNGIEAVRKQMATDCHLWEERI